MRLPHQRKTMTKKISSPATQESLLKDQAKKLHKALSPMCPALTYAQTLEGLARSAGNRTLHVYRAQAPVTVEGAALQATARRMASRLFFKDVGAWAGRELELLHKLDQAFSEEDGRGSRYVEACVHALTHEDGCLVQVRDTFDMLLHDQWKPAFEGLVQDLAQGLAEEANLSAEGALTDVAYLGLARDWRVGGGELSLSEPDAQPFELKVSVNSEGTSVEMRRPGLSIDELEGTSQASIWLEVADGRPVARLYSEVHGDCVLSVHFAKEGLYLEPGKSRPQDGIRPGYPEEGSELRAIHDSQNGNCCGFVLKDA
jgi:hypothetical protein